MQTAIRLNTDGLTTDIEANESTDYLFGNAVNRAVLQKRMEEIENGDNVIAISIEELERVANADD